MSKIHVETTLNGEPTEYLCEPRQSLLEGLRDDSECLTDHNEIGA